jgi:pimeloyl-ACP methyl ester carboxylesterase
VLFPPEFRRQHEAGFTRLAEEAASRPHDAEAFARRLAAILAFDARPLLQTISCPTLVMTARDDQLMPPWFAEEAAAGISNARLVTLDGGGHMLLETRKDKIVDEVTRFL